MRLNLFSRAFAALLVGLAEACRWSTPSIADGTWIRRSVMPLYREGKSGIAVKHRVFQSHHRTRKRHGA